MTALDVLDTKAVAALLRVEPEHVCKLVRRGKLRGFKPGKRTTEVAASGFPCGSAASFAPRAALRGPCWRQTWGRTWGSKRSEP